MHRDSQKHKNKYTHFQTIKAMASEMQLTGPLERTCHGWQLPASCRCTQDLPQLVSRHQVLPNQLWKRRSAMTQVCTCLNSVAFSAANPAESFSYSPLLSSSPVSDLLTLPECPQIHCPSEALCLKPSGTPILSWCLLPGGS